MAMLLTDRLLKERPGYVLSGSVHVALIVAALLSFSHAREFDANVESVPVETLSDEQFSKIMKGEKQAKEVQPAQKAEKIADTPEVKPDPPIAEAKKDVPTPPPPLKRIADPGEAQQDVPTPPQRVAALPPEPPKPEPPLKPVAKVDPPKPQPPVPTPPEKPVIKEEADAEVPKPVRRPDPPKPKPVTPPPEPPKVEAKKPEFKPDQVAKLLEQKPTKPAPPAPAKPKSGDESEPTHRFDTADISKLLSHEVAQRRASSGARLQQLASLGAPNASAAQMSPSLWDQLDGLLQDQYKQCWSYIGAQNLKYVPEIKVQYAQDGSLIGMPQLVNPPSDPALQNLAESAKRAVLRCNPLHIPAVFQPFYEQWRGRIVRFDPQELS